MLFGVSLENKKPLPSTPSIFHLQSESNKQITSERRHQESLLIHQQRPNPASNLVSCDQTRLEPKDVSPPPPSLWQWTGEEHCYRSVSLEVLGEGHVHTGKFLRRAPDAHCGKDMEAGVAEVAVPQGHPLTPQDEGYIQHSLCTAPAAKAMVFIFSMN